MSGQHLRKQATFLKPEGNSALADVPASGRDQTAAKSGIITDAIDVILECLARFSNCAFFHDEENNVINLFMTHPSGNSEFCFPRIWRFSRSKIHFFPRNQSLSVYY